LAFPADKTERRKVTDLKPYPQNPKVHSEEQIRALVAMIGEFGFTKPLLIDEFDTILAGHGATLAACELGFAELPVVVLRGLTDAQKRAIVISDNRSSELSEWDDDLLALELGELKKLDYNLDLTGFSISDFVTTAPATSNEPQAPKSKTTIFLTVPAARAAEARAIVKKALAKSGIDHNL
jgi:hypothetical protein